ncbi:competence/damage-inducible protein A [Streptococcus cameli]
MKAEMIAVGTEILTGQIVNTNAQFLSEKCAELGIDVYFQTAVGDNEERLLSVIDIASKRSDMVILCGGLGPTEDDLTKQTLAKYLKRKLVFDDQAMAKLDQFFASRPGRVRTANNERQAQLVEGSIPLQNPTGLAVGGWIEQDGVTYVVLPGPPSELKPMFTQSLQPLLNQSGTQLYSKVLRFFGIGESQLVTILSEMIAHQTDPTLAPYAKTGEVTLRISTKAETEQEAMERLDAFEAEIVAHDHLADYLYGYGEDNSLSKVLVERLVDSQETIAILEQYTGGLLQAELTANLQDRQLFKGGRVFALENGGADQAKEHAETLRKGFGSDIGVAVFANEIGEKQVELHVAIATQDKTVEQIIPLGGYGMLQLRQIACLNVYQCILDIL